MTRPPAVVASRLAHHHGPLEALGPLDLEAREGEVVGLVGPSGCGKSTLLGILAGLVSPTAGTATVGGAPATEASACALMPQRDCLLPWLRASDNASLALRNRGVGRDEARRVASRVFGELGLAGFEDSPPQTLSGGMRQRVAFARTLLSGKPVLLLDEPFGALDAITRSSAQEWLATALAGTDRTVVLVTHDVEEAIYLCDRVCVLTPRPGRIAGEIGVPDPRPLPRDEAVTDPAFVELRHRAMDVLRGAAP